MASLLAKIWSRIRSKRKPVSIMIVGLDNSGKTSILNSLTARSANTPSTGSRSQSPASSNQSNNPDSSQKHTTDTFGALRSASPDQFRDANLDLDAEYELDDDKQDANNNLLTQDNILDPLGHNNNSNNNGSNNGNILPTVGYNYERVQYRGLTLTVLDFSGQNKYRTLWQEFYDCVDGIVFVIDSSDLIRLVVVRDELENLTSHGYFSSLGPAKQNVESDDYKHGTANQWPQKQLTISQGKLVQSPLEAHPSSTSTSSATTSGNKQCSPNGSCRRTRVPILFLANKADLANSVCSEVIVKALNLAHLSGERHPWRIQATSVTSNQGIVDGFDWLVKQLTSATAPNVT